MERRRSTKQRRMVLKAVQTRKDHPTADQLYLHLRAQDPQISRGTVYRNLNLLVNSGEIRHVALPGVDRFDWRLEPHYHLLCTQCGKVLDVPVAYRAELDQQLSQQTDYQDGRHLTVFAGLCPDCRSKMRENTSQ
jgi:Fe2+ or Zn2+ uptake regulation protein